MLLGVWHFSFTVSNLETSVDFYRDLLGLELMHMQESTDEYIRRLVGYTDVEIRIAQLAVTGQPRGISTHDLELVEYVHPRGGPGVTEIKDAGQAHMAFAVEDIDDWYSKLRRAGVAVVSPPVEITAGVNFGGKACYFFDPDSIVLELLQPPANRRTSSMAGESA